jgi:hypothetical protein
MWTDWWAKRDAGPSLRTEIGADPARLADTLLTAPADRRAEFIIKYRDTKGVQYTEALAAAIPKSPAAARDEVRAALAERMVRMTDTTLRRYLDDPLPEIRRAAALGLAKKGNSAHIDRLADLLLDPDPLVVQGAHEALCRLSGHDFGPKIGSSEDDRAEAAIQWRKWWQAKKAGKG